MQLGMSDVQLRCAKRGCDYEGLSLHRHHVRSQMLFIWHFRRRKATPRYQKFRRNYERFLAKDIVRLCPECHEWVHMNLYPKIRRKYIKLYQKRIRNFTWAQAVTLMDAFEEAFNIWLKKPLH